MATEAEILGRQLIAAKVSAAVWRHGWTKAEEAAVGCHIGVNTYRSVVNNDGSYRPSDDTLAAFVEHLGLDGEEAARLRLGVLAFTGDRGLDGSPSMSSASSRPSNVRRCTTWAALPPEESSLIYNFVVQLKAAATA